MEMRYFRGFLQSPIYLKPHSNAFDINFKGTIGAVWCVLMKYYYFDLIAWLESVGGIDSLILHIRHTYQ
jgi:hypothetical protein